MHRVLLVYRTPIPSRMWHLGKCLLNWVDPQAGVSLGSEDLHFPISYPPQEIGLTEPPTRSSGGPVVFMLKPTGWHRFSDMAPVIFNLLLSLGDGAGGEVSSCCFQCLLEPRPLAMETEKLTPWPGMNSIHF